MESSEEVQEHTAPILDKGMKAISWLGYMPNSVVIVLVTALMFFLFKYKKEALFLILTMGSGIVSSVVKIIANRPRPSQSLVRIIETTRQQSYPSGHVIFYIVFLGFLILLMYQLATIPKFIRIGISVVSTFLILTIPFSRVYLGAHWFTDVLRGSLLSALCLFTISYYYLKNVIIFR
ncbi:phosphatase PAP2 family protein [Mucilaginibacter flavidus]|uniref:phosphatase PAP2 family protein n=1 Tax=Mucilaginibacter flavidus TaxID=2949309 RepID=UPI0020935F35|nr:phosphatase PAP2 family protein [Mucilaginibacter flavidus]MCO5948629.1 phosphatase PAP2 family protein [Mucilaginibacter flavidus]